MLGEGFAKGIVLSLHLVLEKMEHEVVLSIGLILCRIEIGIDGELGTVGIPLAGGGEYSANGHTLVAEDGPHVVGRRGVDLAIDHARGGTGEVAVEVGIGVRKRRVGLKDVAPMHSHGIEPFAILLLHLFEHIGSTWTPATPEAGGLFDQDATTEFGVLERGTGGGGVVGHIGVVNAIHLGDGEGDGQGAIGRALKGDAEGRLPIDRHVGSEGLGGQLAIEGVGQLVTADSIDTTIIDHTRESERVGAIGGRTVVDSADAHLVLGQVVALDHGLDTKHTSRE